MTLKVVPQKIGAVRTDITYIARCGRRQIVIEWSGKRQTLDAWCIELGISKDQAYGRLKRGLPIELVLSNEPLPIGGAPRAREPWAGFDSLPYELDERAQKMVEQRSGQGYGLHELAVLLGVSHERIRQIQVEALRKLRHNRLSRQHVRDANEAREELERLRRHEVYPATWQEA